MTTAHETGVALLPRPNSSLRAALAFYPDLACHRGYRQVVALWLGVFCAGFCVFPGEWEQRCLFYVGIALTLPAALVAVRHVRGSALFWALTGFLAYSALSPLWSDRWLAIGDQVRRAACIEYFLLVCCWIGLGGTAQWRPILRGVMAFAALAAAVEVIGFMAFCRGCTRLIGYGAHANANYTASVTAVVAVLGLAAVVTAPGRRRRLWLVICQVPLVALLLAAGGRAALLAYAGALLLTALLMGLRTGPRRAVPVVAATACGITALVLAIHWIAGRWMAAELGRGDTGRVEIWAANVQRIMQHPWFGHGSNALDRFAANGKVIAVHAHNLFLAQAYYGGAVGFGLWVAVFALAIRASWRAWRAQGDIVPGSGVFVLLAIGMLDIGYVVVDVQAIWLYVWVVLGVALSYDVAARAGDLAPPRPAMTA